MKRIVTQCIRLYQWASRALAAQPIFYSYSGCRAWPTCSEYAIEAVEKHGVTRGLLAAGVRIAKCNSLNKSTLPTI